MRRRRSLLPAAILAVVVPGLAYAGGRWIRSSPSAGARRQTIEVVARRYGFEPAVIRVARGDEVHLRFASLDVVHGFSLEGYDIDVVIEPLRREVDLRRGPGPPESQREVVFTASRAGKFRFRCSKTCGSMHPFMSGELIVTPNWLLRGSSAAAVGLLMGGLIWVWRRMPREETP